MKRLVFALFAGVVAAATVHADDWPQFRGPDRSGVSKERGLLKVWPKGGPKLAWTFKNAGLGYSSVAIAKGVVYTLGTDAACTDEYAIAIDEKEGKELWRHKIGPLYTYKGNQYGDGPRGTPTIDGNFLYALGGTGQLVCVDIAKKNEVWRKHLINDLGGVIMDKYGFSESPLIDGDHLICTPGGPMGTLAALNKTTGKVVWRSKGLTNDAPFSSIVAAEFFGVRQYIQTNYASAGDIHGELSGIDAKGNLLWTKTIFTNTNDGIGTGAVVSGDLVYITAGFGGGCHLFEINKKQEAKEMYKKATWKKVKNTHGGVVLLDGHIYGHSERSQWICQELKTGAIAWDDNMTLKCESGAITAAEGKLYLYTDDGEVGLADADPTAKALPLISSFEIPMQSALRKNRNTSRMAKIWTHPVIANGHLYLRDQENIFAYKITK